MDEVVWDIINLLINFLFAGIIIYVRVKHKSMLKKYDQGSAQYKSIRLISFTWFQILSLSTALLMALLFVLKYTLN